MRTSILLSALLAALTFCACAGQTDSSSSPVQATEPEKPAAQFDIDITPYCTPEAGWMSNAWNWAHFRFASGAPYDLKVTGYKGSWRGQEEGWTEAPNLVIPAKGEVVWDSAMYYPNEAQFASPEGPLVMGFFTLEDPDGRTMELPAPLPVRTAVLETPLAALTGTYMAISLQRKHWTGAPWEQEVVQWMDEAYKCMWDLTGHRPFKGALSRIEETPNEFAWAYAGNPVVLTSRFVPSTMEDFHQGLMSFGWTHEMGHNFDDEIGDYYCWSGPCSEFHANFKLCYAFTHMPSARNLGIRWNSTEYYPFPKERRLPLEHLPDAFFLAFGDKYLADPARTWDSMDSDEINSFFQRIVKVYGWGAMQRWYRLFVALAEKGVPLIEKAEDRLPVALAALEKATGQDLLPLFKLWRFPVTREQLDATASQYGWDK